MIRIARFLLIPALVLCLACGSSSKLANGEYYRVDRAIDDPRTRPWTPIDLETLCFPEDLSKDASASANDKRTCSETAYAKAAKSTVERNRLQAYLMAASDSTCAVHASAILNTQTNVNLTTGLIALGLGAAAPLIKPITAKNAFAAGAALATGSRSLFNDEVYKQMLVTSILKAVRDSREAEASVIRGRQAEDIQKYSVDDAVRDVLEYHDRCSFYRGIVDLSEAVEKKATCSAIGARRDAVVANLARTGLTAEVTESYKKELEIVDKQIAECR